MFIFSDEQQAVLLDLRRQAEAKGAQQGAWRDVYLQIYEFISDKEGATYTPKQGVERSTWLWVRGAADVNSNTGYFANFIRSFSAIEYKARTGQDLAPGALDRASNDIARRFLDDSLRLGLPTILRTGEFDAGGIANGVFSSGPGAFQPNELFQSTGDYAPWPGTLLFAYLGVDQFFKSWILKQGEPERYQVGDTYDLISMLQAVPQLRPGVSDAFGAWQNLRYILSNNNLGAPATEALMQRLAADTDEYLNSFYGLGTSGALRVGNGLFPVGFLEQANFGLFGLSVRAQVGTLGGDGAGGTGGEIVSDQSARRLINAGKGDDTVAVKGGPGSTYQMPPSELGPGPLIADLASVLDGGEGDDTLRYDVSGSTKLTATIEAVTRTNPVAGAPTSRVRVEGVAVEGGGKPTDLAYNFEHLKLGAGDDEIIYAWQEDRARVGRREGRDGHDPVPRKGRRHTER